MLFYGLELGGRNSQNLEARDYHNVSRRRFKKNGFDHSRNFIGAKMAGSSRN